MSYHDTLYYAHDLVSFDPEFFREGAYATRILIIKLATGFECAPVRGYASGAFFGSLFCGMRRNPRKYSRCQRASKSDLMPCRQGGAKFVDSDEPAPRHLLH